MLTVCIKCKNYSKKHKTKNMASNNIEALNLSLELALELEFVQLRTLFRT